MLGICTVMDKDQYITYISENFTSKCGDLAHAQMSSTPWASFWCISFTTIVMQFSSGTAHTPYRLFMLMMLLALTRTCFDHGQVLHTNWLNCVCAFYWVLYTTTTTARVHTAGSHSACKHPGSSQQSCSPVCQPVFLLQALTII